MKWLKHFSGEGNTPAMAGMIAELGYEGYGVYWRIMELLAAQADGENCGQFTCPTHNFCGLLGITQRKFAKFCRTFSKFQIFSVEFSENTVTIKSPNLLKLQDTYTQRQAKKFEQSSNKLRSRIDKIRREEKREDIDPRVDKEIVDHSACGEIPSARPVEEKISSIDAEPEQPQEQITPQAQKPKAEQAALEVTKQSSEQAVSVEPALIPGAAPSEAVPKSAPPPETYRQPDISFDQFFDAYPEGHAGGLLEAEEAWTRLRSRRRLPGLPKLLNALTEWEESENWTEKGGKYIPSAAKFLRNEYWNIKPRARLPAQQEGDMQPSSWTPNGQGNQLPRANTVHQQQIQDRDKMARLLLAMKEKDNDNNEQDAIEGHDPERADPSVPELPEQCGFPRAVASTGRNVGRGSWQLLT